MLPEPLPARPCPFCGQGLRPAARNTGYSHAVGSCFMSGHHIGAALVARWNQRAQPLWLEVVDDGPVFNVEGRGRPVDADKVNEIVAYLRG